MLRAGGFVWVSLALLSCLLLDSTEAFRAPSTFSRLRRIPGTRVRVTDVALRSYADDVYQFFKSREMCPPEVCIEQLMADKIRALNLPDWFLHWGHPFFMSVVLLSMGGYGTYLGWKLRTSKGQLSDNELKAVQMHPSIMAFMFLFYAIGSTGGYGALILERHPVADSDHAKTAVLSLVLLALQSVLAVVMGKRPALRTAHALLGSSTMLVLLLHVFNGFKLGLGL